MRTDHAIVIQADKSIVEMLEYLTRKANRLGMNGREITRVYIEEDSEGKHVYYESERRVYAAIPDEKDEF
jgi:hypothetical protein